MTAARRIVFALAILWAVGATVMTGAAIVSTAVFTALSSVVEAATGLATIRSRQNAEIDAERARTRAIADDLDAERRRATQLEGRVQGLEQDKARLRRAAEVSYRGGRRSVSEAVSDTTERIARRTVTSTSRSMASIYGEALPLVGTAVIVASLGWELYDACETIKDLHELDVAFNPENAIDEREVCGMRAPTASEVWITVAASPGAAWGKALEYYDQLQSYDVGNLLVWLTRLLDYIDWLWGDDPLGQIAERSE